MKAVVVCPGAGAHAKGHAFGDKMLKSQKILKMGHPSMVTRKWWRRLEGALAREARALSREKLA
jgi:hypothetical protein